MRTMILLALFGAILYAVIGTVWYSMLTPMGRLHMHYLGFDKLSAKEQEQKMKEAAPTMRKSYLGQIILALLTSFFTVFVVMTSIAN